VARDVAAKYVGDRGKAVVGLVGGHVVDVRRAREVRGLVGDVPRQRVRIVPPRERLTERCRLDDSFVRELFVRRSHDAQTRRRAALAGEAGCLRREVRYFLVLIRPISLLRRLLL
jgi:hypothetical protein